MMYVVLCCYGIWDVGGAWHWMVVLQRKTIRAVARHGENGQVTHVLSISRQGFHHTHLTLVVGNAKQTRRQATINAAETTMDPQSVLALTKGVMHESYNSTDSVCKSSQCFHCILLLCLVYIAHVQCFVHTIFLLQNSALPMFFCFIVTDHLL